MAAEGDVSALDELLRRHYSRVFALCRRIAGNEADAADAAQEALIAIARGLSGGRFDGKARFATWAHRVSVNSCLDELRRRKRRPVASEELDLHGDLSSMSHPGMTDAIADRLDVDAALARLPLDFRAAVVLRDLCDLDYATIGEILVIPPGTVRSRIARGRAALVPLLGNPGTARRRPTSTP